MRSIILFSQDGKHTVFKFHAPIKTTIAICQGFAAMGYRVLFSAILF